MSSMANLNRPSEVIYQIYPASFQDSNGDGIGDLNGITQRLDYVKRLGVDAIWISPFFLSPKGKAGDGGYAITDYTKIDPQYGTEEDFRRLLNEAHAKGLRVYTDFVVCHTSHEHEWFQKSRNRESGFEDYYVWHDGRRDESGELIIHDGKPVPPNNWQSVFGGSAWSWDDQRQQFYLRHFNSTQPALNLNVKKVQDASLQQMKYWLDMGVDGLRLDALPFANYDPKLRDNPWMPERHGWQNDWMKQWFSHSMCQPQTIDFVKRIRAMLDSYGPEASKIALGEVIAGRKGGDDSMDVAAEYLDPQIGLHTSYTQSLVQFYNQYPDPGRLKKMIADNTNLSPDGGFCINLGNHDFPRYATRMLHVDKLQLPYDVHQQIIKQMMMLAVTLPGSFCMYQGEELGLPQADEKDLRGYKRDEVAIECRDGCRTPHPWKANKRHAGFSDSRGEVYLPVPNSHRPLAVDVQETPKNSMLNFTRRLIQQRKENLALQRGKTTLLDTYGDLVAFIRETDDQAVLCAFNMSGEKIMFKPSDIVDEKTLSRLNIKKDDIIHLDEYGTSFHGLKETREIESGMHPAPPPHQNGNGNGHTTKRIFSIDMLIADNHVPFQNVASCFKSPFENGSRFTIDKDLHTDLLQATPNPETTITAGGATGCTFWTLKKLLGDTAEITLMGLAGEGRFGKEIKTFLDSAGIITHFDEWPKNIPPETTVSHIITHSDGKQSVLTYPGKEVEAVHQLLERPENSRLLDEQIHRTDIVYIPESIVEKFGMPLLDKLVHLRWIYNKELVLSLPSHANFGPSDSDKFRFLIPSCNVVIGNDVEFCRIMGGNGIDHASPWKPVSDEQVKRAAQLVQKEFEKEVLKTCGKKVSPHGQVALITRGEKPALLVTKEKIVEIPTPEVDGVKNMLGAGYAAAAGFLAGYIEGLPHEKSAQIAVGLASQKLRQHGNKPYIESPESALGELFGKMPETKISAAVYDFFGLRQQHELKAPGLLKVG